MHRLLPSRLAACCGDRRLASAGRSQCGTSWHGRWSELGKKALEALQRRLCEAPLPFSGKDSNKDEFVTAGGVAWAGVDATRMASRLVPGLFFAGELLDVDGITGGHNFQSCWTTGMVAGTAAAQHATEARGER